MAAINIFPLAQWLEGTNQNSTPANDNALRLEAALAPAFDFSISNPGVTVEHAQYIVGAEHGGSGWGGFSYGNIIMKLGGVWVEYAAYPGQVKSVDDLPYIFVGGVWQPLRYIGDGHSGS